MAGPRNGKLVSIPLGPGVYSNTSKRSAKTRQNFVTWDRWIDANWVRWHKLLPEKVGGWQYVDLGAPILGVCRGLEDWATLDGQLWIAVGTHLKLYLVNQQTLYDVTPLRQTTTPASPFATTINKPTVVVTDANLGNANTGDYVDISGSTGVGGFSSFDGSYPITVLTSTTYSITMPTNATSTASGGGTPTIAYEVSVGLADNSYASLGFGVGPFGNGTYGTARASGTLARLRTWSLQNYGQDLIASFSDGGIYWWQYANWPATVRAGLLTNAPTQCQRVIAQSDSGFIVAYGCTDLSGSYDPMLIRWCDPENITIWTPAITNLAGNYILKQGSRIVTALRVQQGTLIWTDTYLYWQSLGGTNVFTFEPIGTCYVAGPNAVVEFDGIAYIFGMNDIYQYAGSLQEQPCEVWSTVFDNEEGPGFDRSQAEKVYGCHYEGKNEITWYYPSYTGNGECDRYVTFNYADKVWYYGQVSRTAMADSSAATNNLPYGVNGGYLYEHEVGTDAIEPTGTVPIGWWMRSLDLTTGGVRGNFTIGGSDMRFAIGASDAHLLVSKWVPDFNYLNGTAQITVYTKKRPQQANYKVSGPKKFTAGDEEIDLRSKGSQVAIQIDNLTGAGGAPSLGSSFRMGPWQALAVPYGHR